ncbi:MAG: winged helix-turn-helix domain-containing protein, partial [Bdellovibrio sp.]
PHLDLIKLYYRQGSFAKVLEESLELLSDSGIRSDERSFLFVVRLAFQSALEARRLSEVQVYIEEIRSQSSAAAQHILGMWELAHGNVLPAENFFQSALQKSLVESDHELTSRLLHALATVKVWLVQWQEAEAYLEKVLFLCHELKLDEIEASALILKAAIYSGTHRLDEALDTLWRSYEIAKRGFHFNIQAGILLNIAKCYEAQGDRKLMQVYASLAVKGLDEAQFPRLFEAAQNLLRSSIEDGVAADLSVNKGTFKVCVRNKGVVDFGQQHILFDLLMLFATHPGKRFGKEHLVGLIWNQIYDPKTHDNLIYVSIRRLRNILEPQESSPIFILRDRQGYYLSSSVVVEILQAEGVR